MATHTVPFREALKFWIKLGFISFGGPAGQIAIMHQEVVEAVFRIGNKALKHGVLYAFGALAFIAIFFLKVPFPYIVAAAALGGLLMQRWLPQVFCKGSFDPQTRECRIEAEPETGQKSTAPSFSHVLRVFLNCLVLWAIVVGTIWIWRGYDDTLTQIGLFFTKAAFVTFGGAYAVLSYITEVAVSNGWLSTQQMLIGLGLAESTPGPLIMVTQYAGFLAAWNLPGGLNPLNRDLWVRPAEIEAGVTTRPGLDEMLRVKGLV